MSATTQQPPTPTTPSAATRRWTPSRVVLLILAGILLITSAGALVGAGGLGALDDRYRDGAYLTTDETPLRTEGHALAIDDLDLDGLSESWILGRARLRATGADPDAIVFIGVARSDDAADYLRGVHYSSVTEIDDPETRYDEHSGGAPSTEPADSDIWVAQTSGPGTQELRWTPEDGSWTAIVMNADGSAVVDVQADVGATVPWLERTTWALWIVGAVLALGSAAILASVVLRLRRSGS